MTYAVGFIGTGPEPEVQDWGNSAAMAYRHAPGYQRLENCEIVACADIVRENAEAFAEEFGISGDGVFEDAVEMLETVQPDVVSISTPVPTHAPLVLDALRTGVLDAIHCEKPMATTWGDARLMAQEADRRDVQLTFNHQRRMAPPWRDAKGVIDGGAIGSLQRLEISCGELLDNGTHYIDLANMYNGERQPEWVLGNLDYREEHLKYGAHNENQGLSQWAYGNGVHGLAATGYGSDLVGATVRALGTEGELEVNPGWSGSAPLRYRAGDTNGWESVETGETDASAIELAIEHAIDCLESGTEPELSARHALSTTEVIFATYESAHKRGRVELPLRIEDNPLEEMVETGALQPEPAEDD